MRVNGEIVKQEKFRTGKENLRRFFDGVPEGTKVALESVGFCWPWIDYTEEVGYRALLANPVKVRSRAEDVKKTRLTVSFLLI